MNEMYKVLVVDDEMLVRQGIKHILNWEQYGFQIVGEASNGKEALGLIESLHPHIVLTDIVMPVMDGEELTRMIKQRWPEIEVIILSSFSEFDYVRSTFQSGVSDYILKPHLETGKLLETLTTTVDKILLEHNVTISESMEAPIVPLLERLLSGYDAGIDVDTVQTSFPHPCFYLLGAPSEQSFLSGTGKEKEGQDYSREDGLEPERKPIILAALKALYPGMIVTELKGCRIPGDPQLSLYLLNMNEQDKAALPYRLKKLHAPSVSQNGSVRWVLSRHFSHCSELGDVYRNSLLQLLQYRFFLPRDVALMPEELPPSKPEVKDFQLYIFTEYIRRFQFAEAFQQLRDFIAEQRLFYKGDVFEFKSFIGNIVFNVIHSLGNMNNAMRMLEETKYTYFKMIDEAQHIDDIISLLDSFHLQVEQSVYAAKEQHASNPSMKLLLDYINEHYSEPITLTEMSMHFHFNPSYLSSFFATHHHEGFKEHLNRVRIDKAAELLRKGEIPISEIGSMVGYGDHSYFCKVFKKSTGISPSQYRRAHYQHGEMDI